jgi:hypothetical protein
LARYYWSNLSHDDPRKEFAGEVVPVLQHRFHSIFALKRGAA